MKFLYYLTQNGYWHIRIQNRNWNEILCVLKPYFSYIYNSKFTAFNKLSRIKIIMDQITSQKQKMNVKFMYF